MNLLDVLFPWVALTGAGASVLWLAYWSIGGFGVAPMDGLLDDGHE